MVRLSDIRMKPKLITLFLLVGVIPLAITAWLAYTKAGSALGDAETQAGDSLEKQAFSQLVALRDVKKKQTEQYFNECEGDMGVLVETVATLRGEAFKKLNAIREIKKSQIEQFFEERKANARVLADSPFVREAFKDLDKTFDDAGGAAGGQFKGHTNERYDAPKEYTEVHDKYFATFKYLMEQNNLYDVFLLDPDQGDTLFTVTKEADFGQRASEIDSSLRDVWRLAAKEGKVAVSDTRPYTPSGDAPAQFVAAPIRENDKIIGVVAIQIALDAINRIMTERSGMGQTGETYLVGPDQLMRSDSFLDPENHSVAASFKNPDKGKVDTEASRAAVAGNTDAKVIIDYNGNPILSAYEVRKLAECSNQAAGEITSLIKESTGRVEEGAKLSEETGEALKNILQGVEATGAKIGEIATATVQQAANADEVSKAVQGISEITEQAAAGSEEMASSSEELGAQATALTGLVARFKTEASHTESKAASAATKTSAK